MSINFLDFTKFQYHIDSTLTLIKYEPMPSTIEKKVMMLIEMSKCSYIMKEEVFFNLEGKNELVILSRRLKEIMKPLQTENPKLIVSQIHNFILF